MIEMLIIAMILSSVTLRVAGNAAVDVAHAVRGKESPRYARAKARSWRPSKPSGPASRYFSQLWEDSWTGALDKRNMRKARQRPDKPRGTARVFWSGIGQDARRAVLRKWDRGWTSLDEKRRSRSTRVPDGTDVVPGAVVPEPPVPTDPEPVQVEPDSGSDPTEPTGTDQHHEQHPKEAAIKDCRNCDGAPNIAAGSLRHTHDEYCIAPDILYPEDATTPGHQATTTLKENPTMTVTSSEVVGLDQAISYCEASAAAHKEQIIVIEQTQAALTRGDVTSPAAGHLATAMDGNATCQAAMEAAAAELRKQKAIQEQYDAVPGAGTREFITNGR